MLVKDTYCSYCGAAYAPPLVYPRTCAGCGTVSWANPLPVALVLLPIVDGARTGLLVIRRDIEPGRGKLALAGGFLEESETWAEGGARELREEAGVVADPRAVEPFWFTSTAPRPNRVLLFGLAAPVEASALAPFVVNHETSERGIIFGARGLDELFAFSLHVEAARRFFASRGVDGEHGYTRA